jgi:putative ABC transport system permease protein
LFDVQSMEAILDADQRQNIIFMQILDGLAAVALGLAALGIWGVMAQLVAQRTHEIGVRMALGATSSQVLALMVRFGVLPVAVGLVFGLGAGVGAARLLRGFLFQVTPADPLTLATTAILLGAAALVALLDPVRRALRLDPAQVLRME